MAVIILLFPCTGGIAQEINWTDTKEWKFYNVNGDRGLRLSIDSIVHYPYIAIDNETLSGYLKQMEVWPKGKRSVWMGVYHASFVYNGAIHKLDISVYGGFVYDEVTKRFYQLPEHRRNDWMEWLGAMKARLNKLP